MSNCNNVLSSGIRRRGKSYEFTVSVGFDGNGKHIRKYTTFTPPEGVSESKSSKLANEAYNEFAQKVQGNKALNENMRFRDLVDLYFKEYAPNSLKIVTVYNYQAAVKNHINPFFGNYKLKDLQTSEISEFLTSLKCKSSTARKIKIVMHGILKYAKTQKYIKENPCEGTIWKNDVEGEYGEISNILTIPQAQKLMVFAETYSVFNVIIKLLLLTGMRSGEALGLRWSCVDFVNKTILIDKTLSYANNQWFLSSPKTKRSLRTISIDDKTVALLIEHKKEQQKVATEFGGYWQHPELVFTSSTGHWYDRSLLNTQFRRFISKHNKDLPNITIHGLRHTNCSILIYAGENLDAISQHLGHASSEITSRIYSHMLAEVKVRITKTISDTLKF